MTKPMAHFPTHWQPLTGCLSHLSPCEYQWLSDRGSLTKRLSQLKILAQYIRSEAFLFPEPEESCFLSILPSRAVLIRETDWVAPDEMIWVSTRAIIPGVTTPIGNISLGDLLFKDPHLKRSPFEVRYLAPQHWMRRSIFTYLGQDLLVRETFFPPIFT